MSRVRVLFGCLLLLLGIVTVPRSAVASVDSPTVTGPITGGIHGFPLWDSWFDLTELGYEEAEYFISGTAHQVDPSAATAPYTTRIIVTRPSDPAKFNGTVILDWVNVTAQFENSVDVVEAHEYLLREGYAYVHVSAQAAGICCTPLTPQVWDPVRYGSLSHPGDNWAYDMFSQVAKSIDAPVGIDPLDKLPADRVLLASGQSQSASKLDTYVRQVQPSAGVIDGFLIHGGGSKSWSAPPSAPVFHLLSDAEASAGEPFSGANYRNWEIAGSAHSDFWIGYHQEVGQGPRFAGGPKQPASADEEMHAVAGNYGEQPHPMHGTCVLAGAAFPMRYSVSAAFDHLNRWVRGGAAPPAGPRFSIVGGELERDANGNALGGIRLAPVEAPVARYESDRCVLGGLTVPFTEPQLIQLYGTHTNYYSQVLDTTVANVAAGYLLREDARDLLARACAAKNRFLELGEATCEDPFATIEAKFDVRAGTINKSNPPKSGVAVTFLSDADFDATTIDASTVCVFEEGRHASSPCGLLSSRNTDANLDGVADLVMRFDATKIPATKGKNKTICASGETKDSALVHGCDFPVNLR